MTEAECIFGSSGPCRLPCFWYPHVQPPPPNCQALHDGGTQWQAHIIPPPRPPHLIAATQGKRQALLQLQTWSQALAAAVNVSVSEAKCQVLCYMKGTPVTPVRKV
jgi:hypothetical protein